MKTTTRRAFVSVPPLFLLGGICHPDEQATSVVDWEAVVGERAYRDSTASPPNSGLFLLGGDASTPVLVHVDEDGTANRTELQWSSEKSPTVVSANRQGETFVAGPYGNPSQSRVTKLDAEGRPAWQVDTDIRLPGRRSLAHPTSDLTVLIVAYTSTSGFRTEMVGIDSAEQSVRWRQSDFSDGYVADVCTEYEDGLVLGGRSARDDEAGWLARVSDRGEQMWLNTYDNSTFAGVSGVSTTESGSIVAVGAGGTTSPGYYRVATLNGGGKAQWSTRLDRSSIESELLAVVPKAGDCVEVFVQQQTEDGRSLTVTTVARDGTSPTRTLPTGRELTAGRVVETSSGDLVFGRVRGRDSTRDRAWASRIGTVAETTTTDDTETGTDYAQTTTGGSTGTTSTTPTPRPDPGTGTTRSRDLESTESTTATGTRDDERTNATGNGFTAVTGVLATLGLSALSMWPSHEDDSPGE